MASMQYQCNQCHMALDDSQIERHISAQHLDYFPFECAWCKEEDQKHFSATKEDMKQHTSKNHNGNNSRHLVSKDDSKEDELKKLAKECRRSAIPQIPSIDSKAAFCNVLDSAASTASATEDDPGLTQVKREIDDDISNIKKEK
ncbi:hypothetical protein DdX_22429 [Ditylenchus destructor]|uniref:C2H2-type domain-containing protein n=1 Tax=Ditylenchus destructor TaxID=166010 RepID=A0AAD4MDL1_9BILA|nr:hypothetical protein DdX_22429 [Ditylenchus destructor]